MRTTVGSLPPAVYWRRRAVVLGALVLGIIVLFVSCSGGDDKNDQHGSKGAPTSSQLPTPAPASKSPSGNEPSFWDGVPGNNGPSLPALGDLESQSPGLDDGTGNGTGTGTGTGVTPTAAAGAGTGQNTNVTVPADGSCADSEFAVMPSVAATTVKRGTPVEITLTVKNIGNRTCNRDVGAGAQELYIDHAASKYWSSDTCSPDKGSDVRQFAPGAQRSYKVTWNGRQSSTCAGNAPSGPNPPPGQFELRARLGTLLSNPAVVLTIIA